jgi:hypothetical protein
MTEAQKEKALFYCLGGFICIGVAAIVGTFYGMNETFPIVAITGFLAAYCFFTAFVVATGGRAEDVGTLYYCPHCHKKITHPPTYGETAICPHCGAEFIG